MCKQTEQSSITLSSLYRCAEHTRLSGALKSFKLDLLLNIGVTHLVSVCLHVCMNLFLSVTLMMAGLQLKHACYLPTVNRSIVCSYQSFVCSVFVNDSDSECDVEITYFVWAAIPYHSLLHWSKGACALQIDSAACCSMLLVHSLTRVVIL